MISCLWASDAVSIWWIMVEHAASLFAELDQDSKRAGCTFYKYLFQFSHDMIHQIETASEPPGELTDGLSCGKMALTR